MLTISNAYLVKLNWLILGRCATKRRAGYNITKKKIKKAQLAGDVIGKNQ